MKVLLGQVTLHAGQVEILKSVMYFILSLPYTMWLCDQRDKGF